MNDRRSKWLATAGLCALLGAGPTAAFPLFYLDPDQNLDPTGTYEYYNADTNQYFLTMSRPEIDALESGRIAGWKRTGQGEAFLAFAEPVRVSGVDAANAATHPVCRFYIPPASHFLSASEAECDAVAKAYPEFIFETSAAFHVFVPDATGACPRLSANIGGFSFQPVYRLWDQHRHGVEHRLTPSKAERDALLGQGWVSEGYGADGVAMCAPKWE